ncbi:hypothetical protein EF904_33200 [Streptomyces sp. WAC05950]|nr:hypothetical protein EF904_33200 [Streptomyces sp. WAC05950]
MVPGRGVGRREGASGRHGVGRQASRRRASGVTASRRRASGVRRRGSGVRTGPARCSGGVRS